MKQHGFICIIVICLYFFASPCKCTDLAFVSGSVGTDIVLRCIELIDDSGIFANDEQIVRRIAYVESRDGVTYSPGSGGIWKVSATVLEDHLSGMNASSFYPSIETHFNIQWENVTYEDLDTPIYSALAVRLVLAGFETTTGFPIPPTVESQYLIWGFVFQEDAPSLTQNEFIELVNSIPSVALCPSIYRDIIFVIDNSATVVPDPTFEPIKAFLMDVVDHFRISSTHTRVGIIQYGSEPQVSLTLSQGISSSAVNSTIAGLTNVRTSLVFTGIALGQAISLFDPNQGGRSADSGVARVIVLITHTNSSDNLTSQIENAASESVGIIAIGVTGDVSREELVTLASGNETTHVFQAATYSALMDITSEVEDRICEAQVIASGDRRISGSLQPGETVSFALAIPPEGKDLTLSTSEGTVSNYFSTTITIPSSVAHDFRMNANVPGTPVFYSYQVPDNRAIQKLPGSLRLVRNTNGDTLLYSTIEATSGVTAVYLFLFGNPSEPNITTVSTPVVISVVPETTELTDAEIAGIVCACLIFVAGVVIALIYYWFCRISPKTEALVKETPLMLSTISRTSTRSDMRNEPVEHNQNDFETKQVLPPVYENVAEDPVNESSLKLEVLPPIPTKTAVLIRSPSTLSLAVDTHESKEDASASSGRSSPSGTFSEYSIEDEIRNKLRTAIETNDVIGTSSAIAEFHSQNMVDVDGDLIRGERVIGLHECMQGLSYAISKRDVKTLERAIFVTKQKNYQGELETELEKSEILLHDLKKLEKLMIKLNQALNANDTQMIGSLTFQIRAMSGFDKETVDRMLGIYQCREDFNTALTNRDVELASKTLERVKENGYESDFKTETRQAEKMIKELVYLEKVRKEILSLSQAKIGEIRSYTSPPTGVHEVMQAVYYILGYSRKEIENWTDIRALMGRTDKERLKAQILNIDPRKVKLTQVELAKSEIESFDVKTISNISLALGLFYVFVSSVIEEVEKLNSGILSAPSPFFFELASRSASRHH